MQFTQITGNLGSDPVVKNINGYNCIEFSVAETLRTYDGNTPKDTTTWYKCSLWKKPEHTESVTKWLKKGTRVLVGGRLTVQLYTNRDGQAASSLNIKVETFEIQSWESKTPAGNGSGNNQQNNSSSNTGTGSGQQNAGANTPDDDLPF